MVLAGRLWRSRVAFIAINLCGISLGHIAAWTKGTYCLNGTTPGVDDQNSHLIVDPLYQLHFNDWWMHHVDNCDQFPPAPGDFLEIPALGAFTVEHAVNRAFTTLSYDGQNIATYPDGQDHPDLENSQECIQQPNIHTQNESMAAGSAFAISYTSNLTEVTPTNLVVFSVLYKSVIDLSYVTRLNPYNSVHRGEDSLPIRPPGYLLAHRKAWGWVPNGCGTPNMYMHPLRCNVTGPTGNLSLAQPQPPVWCEGNVSACTNGAKQVGGTPHCVDFWLTTRNNPKMIYWNQLEGNNIGVSGQDLSGAPKFPGYDMKCGFADGPQNDIFSGSDTTSPSPTTDPSAALRLWDQSWGKYVGIVLLTAVALAVNLL
ncbi:hypothetical protein D9756_009594 [Leucocoprinus leucothites]|uniref:Uncharacterized protein n=1 Tax=Leucocoprinus leucothites TaxID=201217 RepID=A0A8H5FTD8_9AGAR|nr:hypothetical protein D9756_009594 [Leucoagaricus leucothites]